MARVNRVDSLSSELRDIKRRLHALETALGAVTATAVAAGTAAATAAAAETAAANAQERPGQPPDPG